jgi:nanoRNase/pAp phosphatase (c-di-AMP/oligoRNAs hydrolase)
MNLGKIIGSKSKIKLLKVLFSDSTREYTIRQLALKSKVPYSVTYIDIKEFLKMRLILKKKNKINLNTKNEGYELLKTLFVKKEIQLKKLRKELSGRETLIITHHNADPDSLGSAISLARGLYQLKTKSRIFAPGGISRQSKLLLKRYPYPVEYNIKKFPELVFTIDVASPEQINNIEIPKKSRLIAIDHHELGEITKKADIKFLDKDAHSSSVLVYELLKKLNIKITKEIAFFLLVGIVTDTSFFRIADKRDINIVNNLLNYVNLEEVFIALSNPEEISEKIAKLKAMKRLEIYRLNNKLLVFSKVSSYESSVASSLIKMGADVAFVENVRKNETRISARARRYLKGRINLVEILGKIEGLIGGHAGGHSLAASANGRNTENSRNIRGEIIKEFERKFRIKAKKT